MDTNHEHEWAEHADWWLSEIRDDHIYASDVHPLLDRLIGRPSGIALDLGCGEGRVMSRIPGTVVGCDVSIELLRLAGRHPVVLSELPDLRWLRPGVVDTAYMVLVIEHLPDLEVFASAARVVRPGGSLVVVMNHPAFTAEGSGPIVDPADGEVLWRWGSYFVPATTRMATPAAEVTFYHRPLATILSAAGGAGWMLEELVETGLSAAAVAAEPGYLGQEQMPRLLGARWMNTQGSRSSRR